MSVNRMFVIDKSGDVRDGFEYQNAFHGAMLIWLEMGQKYGVVNRSNPVALGAMLLDEDGMKPVWALAKDPKVEFHDRVTMATTFDRAMVKSEHFPQLVDCLRKSAVWLPKHCHVARMADDLESLKESLGVCWQQTSAAENLWLEKVSEDEETGEPEYRRYNIFKDSNHWSIFDDPRMKGINNA